MTLTKTELCLSQKSVVCDEPSRAGERSNLVAYLGGIDLTDGRWEKEFIFWSEKLKNQIKC